MSEPNSCLSCGACCAFFRASFFWGETDANAGNDPRDECSDTGCVPADMTENITPFRVAMRGTNQPQPRCIALTGQIGKQVSCLIHPVRASVCRAFPMSWENGVHNPDCDRARQAHGLEPLPEPVVLVVA
ncbi:MAG: YkgJ family cysteine cluster protein [Thiolinea sp.]